MEIAVRPHIVAGVALLGAGVIAVSPMAPPVPDIHLPSISTAANNLVALTSPLQLGDAYNQVLQAAIANIQGLIQNVADDPTPILSQMVANQAASLSTLASALQTTGSAAATTLTTQVPALLQTALGQLSASNVTGAVNTLLEIPLAIAAPALGLLPALQQIITQPITNLVNVIKAVTDPINAPLEIVGLVAPLISTTGATGVAFQNVVDALGTGDIQKVANAVLTAPATIADGLLNGGYGPDLGPLVGQPFSVLAGGLLSLSDLGRSVDRRGSSSRPPVRWARWSSFAPTIANALAPQPPATKRQRPRSRPTRPPCLRPPRPRSRCPQARHRRTPSRQRRRLPIRRLPTARRLLRQRIPRPQRRLPRRTTRPRPHLRQRIPSRTRAMRVPRRRRRSPTTRRLPLR